MAGIVPAAGFLLTFAGCRCRRLGKTCPIMNDTVQMDDTVQIDDTARRYRPGGMDPLHPLQPIEPRNGIDLTRQHPYSSGPSSKRPGVIDDSRVSVRPRYCTPLSTCSSNTATTR